MQSLGRRVPVNWVVREFKLKFKLAKEPEMFSLVEVHLILRFKIESNCALVKVRGLWFVTSQLLAMQPWESNFVPG